MKRESLRISKLHAEQQNINLPLILQEIDDGESYNWSILYLYAAGNLGPDKPIPQFEENILKSPSGYCLEWNELNDLAKKFDQIYAIVILGAKEKSLLYHYKDDQVMYETCDFSIVLHDSSYWELFSSNAKLISRWASKFYAVEQINSAQL